MASIRRSLLGRGCHRRFDHHRRQANFRHDRRPPGSRAIPCPRLLGARAVHPNIRAGPLCRVDRRPRRSSLCQRNRFRALRVAVRRAVPLRSNRPHRPVADLCDHVLARRDGGISTAGESSARLRHGFGTFAHPRRRIKRGDLAGRRNHRANPRWPPLHRYPGNSLRRIRGYVHRRHVRRTRVATHRRGQTRHETRGCRLGSSSLARRHRRASLCT